MQADIADLKPSEVDLSAGVIGRARDIPGLCTTLSWPLADHDCRQALRKAEPGAVRQGYQVAGHSVRHRSASPKSASLNSSVPLLIATALPRRSGPTHHDHDWAGGARFRNCHAVPGPSRNLSSSFATPPPTKHKSGLYAVKVASSACRREPGERPGRTRTRGCPGGVFSRLFQARLIALVRRPLALVDAKRKPLYGGVQVRAAVDFAHCF